MRLSFQSPCSFYFHAAMLVVLLEWKPPPLSNTGKLRSLPQILRRSLLFVQQRDLNLSYLSMCLSFLLQHVILSLPLLRLDSKSPCLSPRFCLRTPRQCDAICWELNLVSGVFPFFWWMGWADGIIKYPWCFAGGKGCWLKDQHHIPRVS